MKSTCVCQSVSVRFRLRMAALRYTATKARRRRIAQEALKEIQRERAAIKAFLEQSRDYGTWEPSVIA